jgi:flagellar basal body-associated protein FliL
MNKITKIILMVVIVLLLAGNFYFACNYFQAKKTALAEAQAIARTAFNVKVVGFAKLFTTKVLSADKEIDFETRLQLENSVRATGDQEILEQWNKFTSSANEQEGQINVKRLLELLLNKMVL